MDGGDTYPAEKASTGSYMKRSDTPGSVTSHSSAAVSIGNVHGQPQQQQALQRHNNVDQASQPTNCLQQKQQEQMDMMENDNDAWMPTPLSRMGIMQTSNVSSTASPMSMGSSTTKLSVPPMSLDCQHHPHSMNQQIPHPTGGSPSTPLSSANPKQYQQQQQQQQNPQATIALQQQASRILHMQQQAQLQQQQQQQRQNTVLPGSHASISDRSSADQKYAYLLPSTLMPPSVLAHVQQNMTGDPSKGGDGSVTAGGNRYKKKKGRKSTRVESPQEALERILSLQGFGPFSRITAEEAQYETVPSQLQLASFGTELVKAIHASDTSSLSTLLETGLSPNPCNKFRDSIVDLVCKRANADVFRCLVDHGCDLRVCDGFGRTPLHHCCWASEFCQEIAEIILRMDAIQLSIEDKRGQTPLEYVRPDIAADWIEYLEDNRDVLFPAGGSFPPLQAVRDTRPDNCLPDPPNSLPVQLASAISGGQLTPDELAGLDPELRARFK